MPTVAYMHVRLTELMVVVVVRIAGDPITEQAVPPSTERSPVPVNPSAAVTVIIEVTEVPVVTVTVAGLALREKSGGKAPVNITLTVLLPKFETKTSPFPLSYVMRPGVEPTETVATKLFVTSEIT